MRPGDARFVLAIAIGIVSTGACTMGDTPATSTGIQLEVEGAGASLNTLAEIQAELSQIGVGVWPIRLDDVPAPRVQVLHALPRRGGGAEVLERHVRMAGEDRRQLGARVARGADDGRADHGRGLQGPHARADA